MIGVSTQQPELQEHLQCCQKDELFITFAYNKKFLYVCSTNILYAKNNKDKNENLSNYYVNIPYSNSIIVTNTTTSISSLSRLLTDHHIKLGSARPQYRKSSQKNYIYLEDSLTGAGAHMQLWHCRQQSALTIQFSLTLQCFHRDIVLPGIHIIPTPPKTMTTFLSSG